MSDLGGDTLLAQVLTNVIIGNTSEGKGDHFWDNGEGNLLKALILYVDLDRSRSPESKNLASVYQMLVQNSERQLTALFENCRWIIQPEPRITCLLRQAIPSGPALYWVWEPGCRYCKTKRSGASSAAVRSTSLRPAAKNAPIS